MSKWEIRLKMVYDKGTIDEAVDEFISDIKEGEKLMLDVFDEDGDYVTSVDIF